MRGRLRRRRNDQSADRANGAAVERMDTRSHLIEDNSQGKKVRARVLGLVQNLFGRKKSGGALQRAGSRRLCCVTGDTKVAQLWAALSRDQDIRGFHVA